MPRLAVLSGLRTESCGISWLSLLRPVYCYVRNGQLLLEFLADSGPRKNRIDPNRHTLFSAEEHALQGAGLGQGTTDSAPADDTPSDNASAEGASDDSSTAASDVSSKKKLSAKARYVVQFPITKIDQPR